MKRLILLLAFLWPVVGAGFPLKQVQEWCEYDNESSWLSRGWCESYLLGFADSMHRFRSHFDNSWEKNLRSKACESTEPELITACSYYWLGFYEGEIFIEEPGQSPRVCIEEDVSGTKLREIFLGFAKAKSADLSKPAAGTILSAIQNAFPCR